MQNLIFDTATPLDSSWYGMLANLPSTVDAVWFSDLAQVLLQQTELVVAGIPHRLLEIEFYFHGREHQDPFAHCDPLQTTTGLWYFHRDGGGYRGGSFKGVDISFGPADVFGGILLRSMQCPDGSVINGCSLLVDSLLQLTGTEQVAALDQQIQQKPVWDSTSPMFLRYREDLAPQEVFATARVGLTLKRAYQFPSMEAYLMRPYRFLTDPTIKKGKVYTILALLQQNVSLPEIQRLTQSPLRIIQQYQEVWEQGKSLEKLSKFRGQSLSSNDLCSIAGAWQRLFA